MVGTAAADHRTQSVLYAILATMNKTTIKFCPKCGKQTIQWKAENNIACSSCAFTMYLNTAAAVAVIIECKGKILLAERAHEPGKGLLDLPGGFIDPAETFEQGVARELHEELNLDIGRFEYLFSFPNTYPYKNLVYNTCDLFVRVSYDHEPSITPADDVASVAWYSPSEIDLDSIAFDSIKKGIKKYIES